MNKHKNASLTLILLVATVILVYFMPRDSRRHFNYEENRPWNYSLSRYTVTSNGAVSSE